jgi:hypothetical protein
MTFTSFIEDAECRRRERVSEEWQCRGRMVDRPYRCDDGTGPSNAPAGAPGADGASEDSEDDIIF